MNSIIVTLIASFYADRTGRRKILIVYTALMSLSGAINVNNDPFALSMILSTILTDTL
jgi:MFS family permease